MDGLPRRPLPHRRSFPIIIFFIIGSSDLKVKLFKRLAGATMEGTDFLIRSLG
jgi:hypothetical protein